jgi:hypothetical protein
MVRLPRSLSALEALQWLGLFAGPLAFAAEHLIGLGASFAQCNPAGRDWNVDPHVVQLTAMALAALIAVAGEAAALLAFLGTREANFEDDPPPGRIHFLAAAALVLGPIFLSLVLLNGIGAASYPDCRQS